jgi:hypothetical protein
MIELEFNITLQDEAGEDALLDEYETEALVESTKAQIRQHVENRLGNLFCEEHAKLARVIVTGSYSRDTEQLEIEYHLDTCCKLMMVRSVAALSR